MKRMVDHMRKHHEKFGLCMRELSCTVFSFDEDTANAVERALADGTLNGKVHTPEEVHELHSSGVFMRRYKKYIKRATLSVPTINSKLNTWYTKWKDEYDDKIGERIFSPPMIDRHTGALAHIDDIVDPDLNLYIELRKKPRQKHDLQQLSCQRGEKVEIFHAQQGDFSNGGCRARLAQAQTIEGAVMFTMDRQQEANYHSGTVSSPVVPNYRLWVRLAANREARRSGRRVPFPDAVEPRLDNRERFLYDYYLEQLEREKSGLFTGELTHCPCDSCSARRETCDGLACSSFRRRDAGLTDDQADELLVELTRNPDACADKLDLAANTAARMNDRDASQRARQLRTFATKVRGSMSPQSIIWHSQNGRCLFNFRDVICPRLTRASAAVVAAAGAAAAHVSPPNGDDGAIAVGAEEDSHAPLLSENMQVSLLTYSLAYLLAHSAFSLTHSPTHSLTHSLTHSPHHSLARSLASRCSGRSDNRGGTAAAAARAHIAACRRRRDGHRDGCERAAAASDGGASSSAKNLCFGPRCW